MKEMQATIIYFDSLIEGPVSFTMQDYETDWMNNLDHKNMMKLFKDSK